MSKGTLDRRGGEEDDLGVSLGSISEALDEQLEGYQTKIASRLRRVDFTDFRRFHEPEYGYGILEQGLIGAGYRICSPSYHGYIQALTERLSFGFNGMLHSNIGS